MLACPHKHCCWNCTFLAFEEGQAVCVEKLLNYAHELSCPMQVRPLRKENDCFMFWEKTVEEIEARDLIYHLRKISRKMLEIT